MRMILPMVMIIAMAAVTFARAPITEAGSSISQARNMVISVQDLDRSMDMPSEGKCCAKADGAPSAKQSRIMSGLSAMGLELVIYPRETGRLSRHLATNHTAWLWESDLLRPPISL